MNVKVDEMTLKEIRELGKVEVVMLPWGSCEPHNFHLPYGCDTMAGEHIAVISARKAMEKGARVTVFPAIPVGVNSNHEGFPLFLHMSPATQEAVLKDIVRTLEKQGIRKMVILNAHGGNDFKPILRGMFGCTKMRIFQVNWWTVAQDVVDRVSEDTGGEHGNETETSWCMALFPDLVHLEWADEGKVREPRIEAMKKGWAWTTRPWSALTTNSGHGNPAKATAEKGKKIVDTATDRIAAFLVELSQAEVDENFPY